MRRALVAGGCALGLVAGAAAAVVHETGVFGVGNPPPGSEALGPLWVDRSKIPAPDSTLPQTTTDERPAASKEEIEAAVEFLKHGPSPVCPTKPEFIFKLRDTTPGREADYVICVVAGNVRSEIDRAFPNGVIVAPAMIEHKQNEFPHSFSKTDVNGEDCQEINRRLGAFTLDMLHGLSEYNPNHRYPVRVRVDDGPSDCDQLPINGTIRSAVNE